MTEESPSMVVTFGEGDPSQSEIAQDDNYQ